MTLEEVQRAVARVQAEALAGNHHAAHEADDELREAVLSAIALGAINASELATAALATNHIDFHRWYS